MTLVAISAAGLAPLIQVVWKSQLHRPYLWVPFLPLVWQRRVRGSPCALGTGCQPWEAPCTPAQGASVCVPRGSPRVSLFSHFLFPSLNVVPAATQPAVNSSPRCSPGLPGYTWGSSFAIDADFNPPLNPSEAFSLLP